MNAPARQRRWYQSWSLRRLVGTASLALLVLLAALFTVVVVSLLAFRGRGNQVIYRWQPAQAVSQNLLADLVNQETGVRGYALGRQAAFLAPYRDYLAQERRDERTLAGYLAGRPDLEPTFAAFRRQAERWRSDVARPFVRRVQAGDRGVADAATSDAAKASFDRVRQASARLTARITAVADRARDDRDAALGYVWVAVAVAGALILLAAFGLWWGMRNGVLGPIERLARQSREVAAGALEQQIVAGGPTEIDQLGRDVNTMRARIANELARVERARAVLLERGEELARSNADLEQFAYVASHDLSEPLRKVANFCQLLERQYGPQLDDKARQYIAFAVDGAKRMQVLITDLLAFSRVGRTTSSFAPVDTDAALTRAVATLDERIRSGGATIVRHDLPTVDGDATLLTALFQNLVGNALKYHSPDRPPRIEVGAEQQGDRWQFTVSDNGIGIDRQYAERIFTIFQRLHLRDQYGGTGIGLALCRKIVEFHRGRIWLGETDGPGATFQFTIPQHAQPQHDLPDAFDPASVHQPSVALGA